MNLSAIFIKRPVATTLLALGIAVGGIVAFNLLPVASLPQIEFPTISVQASLPGSSPENMATAVATPLERQLGKIAGITEITSTSNLGSTRVVTQFDLNRNIDGAARDVQAAINAARSNLPINLPNNPTYRKVNPADAPIIIIGLSSNLYTNGQMYDYASTILQQKLSQVEGVGQVLVGGSSLPAIRVELNPLMLNKYNVGLTEVRAAIAANNINQAKGQINSQSNIIANDQMFKAAQYKPIIIAYRNGRPLQLSDVAEVNDSVEDLRNAGIVNGKPSVPLIIFKQPNVNIIETVDKVKNIIPALRAMIPKSIDMTIMMDRTTTIRASLHDVELTLIVAMLLVILIVYLFLRSGRTMLIPGVAVPLSLLGTFIVMKLLNFSLDNLSLMALTISTGFVVDDAIVVVENISRHIENGMNSFEAALKGAQEVGFTVISMSVSLVAVFIPILLMGGIVGRLLREFAITLSTAILVSLFISLTITPMMSSRMIKPVNKNKNLYSRLYDYYEHTLTWALKHSTIMLMVTLLAIILNVVLFIFVPKGFFPQQDTGRITASIQGEQDISFQALRNKLVEFVDIIKQDPAVENVVGFVGTGNNTANAGTMFIMLKPFSKRESVGKVIGRLRNKLAIVTGATLYMQPVQDLIIGGRMGNAQFQYTLTADTLKELNLWAPRVMQKLITLPGIIDVNSDQRDKGLQELITIDRDTALKLGVSVRDIDSNLYSAFGQSQISTIYTLMNQYRVVMEVAPMYWQRPEILKQIKFKNSSGNMIPLSAIAHFEPSATLLSVNHHGQLPSVTLSFNLKPGYSLGDAVIMIKKAVNEIRLPVNVMGSFRGTAEAFQASLANQPFLILFALFVVYVVLGILYESLIHPITILSTLPTAGVGALLALCITRTELSVIAFIGIILLIGIVKKNAIMMIDFALHARHAEKISPREAIYKAALLRFRPIMMTTAAALLGALPLALGWGIGSEIRRPLGIAIVGGLIVSQMLTLYTTPVIYLAFENCRIWCKERLLRALGLNHANRHSDL